MSRSLSMVSSGTHNNCGGDVFFNHVDGKHYCAKCNKSVKSGAIKKN